MPDKIEKTDEQWREHLSGEVYRIARKKGTEPAFTGEHWDTETEGVYECACCGQPLFSSGTKYKSGSGWPSFYEPIDPEHVSTETDSTLGMERIEALCSRCDAHLGHVFPDGPQPTGLRYCINSASLRLEEKGDELS